MPPAPLFGRPDAALHGSASWVEAADGARLRAALFPARGRVRGSVVLSPGRTEPIEKYAEVLDELQGRGFCVLAHDWRGQGLSERFARVGYDLDGDPAGHARGWRRYVSDLSRVLDGFAGRLPRPWIALGHSMGGALSLLAMTQDEEVFDAAVLCAPMLGLRLGGRPQALVAAASAIMTLTGRAAQVTPSALPRPEGGGHTWSRKGDALTHDRVRWAAYVALLEQAPELTTGEQTWGWLQFAFIISSRLRVPGVLEQVLGPVTILAAERDLLVANAPQRAAAARLPEGRYVEVEGAFHEILMETDPRRAVFWREFDEIAQKVAA